MTNLQKYGQLHKILEEAAVYRRAVGKPEFENHKIMSDYCSP